MPRITPAEDDAAGWREYALSYYLYYLECVPGSIEDIITLTATHYALTYPDGEVDSILTQGEMDPKSRDIYWVLTNLALALDDEMSQQSLWRVRDLLLQLVGRGEQPYFCMKYGRTLRHHTRNDPFRKFLNTNRTGPWVPMYDDRLNYFPNPFIKYKVGPPRSLRYEEGFVLGEIPPEELLVIPPDWQAFPNIAGPYNMGDYNRWRMYLVATYCFEKLSDGPYKCLLGPGTMEHKAYGRLRDYRWKLEMYLDEGIVGTTPANFVSRICGSTLAKVLNWEVIQKDEKGILKRVFRHYAYALARMQEFLRDVHWW